MVIKGKALRMKTRCGLSVFCLLVTVVMIMLTSDASATYSLKAIGSAQFVATVDRLDSPTTVTFTTNYTITNGTSTLDISWSAPLSGTGYVAPLSYRVVRTGSITLCTVTSSTFTCLFKTASTTPSTGGEIGDSYTVAVISVYRSWSAAATQTVLFSTG